MKHNDSPPQNVERQSPTVLTVPLTASKAQKSGSTATTPVLGRRILLVDDDEDMRYLDRIILSNAGYIVDTAVDGEEAWEMLLSFPYDLLLSDHNMPRLCGLDLAERVRAAGMRLPIIINSGCLNLGEAANHQGLDLATVLHKQFGFAEVLDAVKRILPLLQGAESFTTGTQSPRSSLCDSACRIPSPVWPAGLSTNLP
jgi:DNA-binding response OmpR family regulator